MGENTLGIESYINIKEDLTSDERAQLADAVSKIFHAESPSSLSDSDLLELLFDQLSQSIIPRIELVSLAKALFEARATRQKMKLLLGGNEMVLPSDSN